MRGSRDVNLCFEPFNENHHKWDQEDRVNYLKRIKDKASMKVVLDELFQRYNALKVLDYQLSSEIYFELLKRKGLKILFLRRRNLVQMAISAMIAHQTGEWQKAKNDSIYNNLKPLELEEIRRRIGYAKQLNAKYSKFLKEYKRGDYMKLWYENLYSEDLDENISRLEEICKFVDITLPPKDVIRKHMTPSLKNTDCGDVYKNIPNLDEIEEGFCKVN